MKNVQIICDASVFSNKNKCIRLRILVCVSCVWLIGFKVSLLVDRELTFSGLQSLNCFCIVLVQNGPCSEVEDGNTF